MSKKIFDRDLTRRELMWILTVFRDDQIIPSHSEITNKSISKLQLELDDFLTKKSRNSNGEYSDNFIHKIRRVWKNAFIEDKDVDWLLDDAVACLWFTKILQSSGYNLIANSQQELLYQLEIFINFMNFAYEGSKLVCKPNHIDIQEKLLSNPDTGELNSFHLSPLLRENLLQRIDALSISKTLWLGVKSKQSLIKWLKTDNDEHIIWAYKYLYKKFDPTNSKKSNYHTKEGNRNFNNINDLVKFFDLKDDDIEGKRNFVMSNLLWMIYLNSVQADNSNQPDYLQYIAKMSEAHRKYFQKGRRTTRERNQVKIKTDKKVKDKNKTEIISLTKANQIKLQTLADSKGTTIRGFLNYIIEFCDLSQIEIPKNAPRAKLNQGLNDMARPYFSIKYGHKLTPEPAEQSFTADTNNTDIDSRIPNLIVTVNGSVGVDNMQVLDTQEIENRINEPLNSNDKKNEIVEYITQSSSVASVEELTQPNESDNINEHKHRMIQLIDNQLMKETSHVTESIQTFDIQSKETISQSQKAYKKLNSIGQINNPFFLLRVVYVDPSKIEDFEKTFKEYVDSVSNEDSGFLSSIAFKTGRNFFEILELYASQQSCDQHRISQGFKEFKQKLETLLPRHYSSFHSVFRFVNDMKAELVDTRKITLSSKLSIRWHSFNIKSEFNDEFIRKISNVEQTYSDKIFNRLGVFGMQRAFDNKTRWYFLEFYTDTSSKDKSNAYIHKFIEDNAKLIIENNPYSFERYILGEQYQLYFKNANQVP